MQLHPCSSWTTGVDRRVSARLGLDDAGRAWLPAGAWTACIGEPLFTAGERIWVGVDVGGERSATAVAWVSQQLHVGVEVFHGDEGVLEAKSLVEDLARDFTIAELVFDPWRFGQAAQELQQRGIPVVEFPQSDARMIPASDRLYRAVIEQRLVLPDHEELRHAPAAIAKHSRRGWRLDKSRGSDNIDALIALCMALERAENQPEPASSPGYENHPQALPRLRPTHPRVTLRHLPGTPRASAQRLASPAGSTLDHSRAAAPPFTTATATAAPTAARTMT